MKWSEISFADRTIRQFAGLLMLFGGGLALWQGIILEKATPGIFLGIFCLSLGILGLRWPVVLRPIYTAWMVLVFPVGWLISHLIQGILFFGLFTPLGIVFRLMRRDALGRRFVPEEKSYWKEKETVTDIKRYLHQY